MSKHKIFFLLSGMIFVTFTLSALSNNLQIDSAIIWQTQKFRTILETASKEHKDSVDIKKLSETAFSAMLKTLDPYSDYLSSETYTAFKNNYNLTIRTVGISLVPVNDTLIVLSVTENSPAEKAGIQTGDKIIYLDGVNAVKMPLQTANQKLANQESSFKSLNLVIKRSGSEGLSEYNLKPDELVIKSLSCFFMLPNSDIGYIKSQRFSKSADSSVRLAIKYLMKSGAKKILFDIRGHQGGQVDQACEIVDEFLTGDKTITYLQGKNNSYYQKYISESAQPGEKLPLIVLIDGETMSASEIFAGAVQDLDRGLIVGQISYGKGMAQKSWEFKDGSAFRLTIGDYYTATGRNIQKPKKEENKVLDPSFKMQMGEEKAKELEKQINESGIGANMPVFKTPNGRTVLGGGGIFPDYFVKEDTTTLLTQVIKSKNIGIEMALKYLDVNKKTIRDKFKNDYKKYANEFVVTEDMLAWLENISKSKNIWNEVMYQTDKEYLKNYLKSLIAYLLWGNDAFYYIGIEKDNVISKAVEFFPEAEKLLKN